MGEARLAEEESLRKLKGARLTQEDQLRRLKDDCQAEEDHLRELKDAHRVEDAEEDQPRRLRAVYAGRIWNSFTNLVMRACSASPFLSPRRPSIFSALCSDPVAPCVVKTRRSVGLIFSHRDAGQHSGLCLSFDSDFSELWTRLFGYVGSGVRITG